MRAVDAAHQFIDIAFKLLDEYKSQKYTATTTIEDVDLQPPFALRINRNGFLYLIEKKPDGNIKHVYSSGLRSGFPAGDLLSQYLTKLY